MKLFLTGLTAILALCLGSSSRAGDLPEEIKKAGVLHLSINATYPPLDYKDPQTSKIVGLDVDLADILASKLGSKSSSPLVGTFSSSLRDGVPSTAASTVSATGTNFAAARTRIVFSRMLNSDAIRVQL